MKCTFFTILFKTVFCRDIQVKFTKNRAITFISEETPCILVEMLNLVSCDLPWVNIDQLCLLLLDLTIFR